MDEFVSWLWEVEFWHWWALGVLLIGIEVFAASTLLLWPAISAFVLGGILLVDPNFDWRFQLLLFAVLAIGSSIGWQMWLRKHPTATDHPMLNTRGRSYVGRRVTLVEGLDNGRGRIRIDDTWWQAAVEDGATLKPGGVIEVADTDGATLIVRPVPTA
ncbi:MAG: NfeD family protein [Alphaproteobacteria bacterium]|nr:NfeD family protein [Alphaproteobacteria bacterium]